MEKMVKEIFQQWPLAVVALLISILLWMAVVGGERIESTAKVRVNYKIPNGLTLVPPYPEEISLRLSGPKAFLRDLDEKDLSYSLDLKSFSAGKSEAVFKEENLNKPGGIDVLSVSPQKINLELDRVITKKVPVKIITKTKLPLSYSISGISAKPSIVEIKGAAKKIDSIYFIPSEELQISEYTLKQNYEVALNLNDLGVQLAETSFKTVNVELFLKGPELRRIFRSIEVFIKDEFGNYFNLEERSLLGEPSRINLVIEGKKEALEAMGSSDIRVYIDLKDKKTGSNLLPLNWALPPGVSVVDTNAQEIKIQKVE